MMQTENVMAAAQIRGSGSYPQIQGTALFRQTPKGVLVTIQVSGLPDSKKCDSGIFALHIHEGEHCTGNEKDAFADTGGHYNPGDCPHPYHAGDLPPLWENHGYAYMSVLTDRFHVGEVIGKTLIIHSAPDDFKTQPSGDAGMKIACGTIRFR